MLCPYCKSKKSKVVDKRDNPESGVTRRRRECLICHKRSTTYERIESLNLLVRKRSGKVEEFDREKLKRGVMKAVKKRPLTEDQIEELINGVELELLNRKSEVVDSTEIGTLVLEGLKRLDKIGYLLFASVYRDFNCMQDFEKAILDLKNS